MKKLYFLPYILTLSCLAESIVDPFDELMQEMNSFQDEFAKEMDNFHKRVENIHSKIGENFKSWEPGLSENTPVKIKIEEDDQNVIVTLSDICDKLKSTNIETQAKDDNLEGTITLEGKKLNFAVQDGGYFTISYTYESVKEDENDKKKLKQTVYSSSSQSRSLPKKVANLENSTVECDKDNNNLKIILPKATSKAGWKKVQVK